MPNPYTLNVTPGDPATGFCPASLLGAASSAWTANAGRSTAGFATAGVPGFAPPDPGTFDVYRRISAHPTVALVMRIVAAPIVANTWDWKVRPGTPTAQVEFIKQTVGPLRTAVVNDAMRALVFGFAAFEKVWRPAGDRMMLAKLKPLSPDGTTMLVDAGGNFRGVRNQLPGQPARDLTGVKAFCYTYDGEYGNYYGRSRHENIRAAWSMAMQTADRLAQYHKKVAGVIAQLHYPEGTSRDAAGVERSNDVVAQQILEAVSMGRSVRFPNLFASIEDPTSAAELAGKSQWVLSQFELGGTDYSPGLLNALAYYDKLLFRGWLRPERVGLEALHGSKADSQQHSETGVVDAELVDADFAAAFNTGVVDDVLEVNFGPAARGAVRADPSPISDAKTTNALAVVTSLLHNAQTADRVASRIDIGAVLQDLDIPDLGMPTGA
jgi:hypothetical protein